MHIKQWLTVSIFLIGSLGGAQALDIDEKVLTRLSRESSVGAQNIYASRLGSKVALESFKDAFQTHAFTEVKHTDSSEKSISNFVPQFGPTDTISLGVQKLTQFGASYSASVYANQQSTVNDSISNATTTGVSLAVDFDLWKDLFGRSTRSNLKSKKLSDQKNKIETELQLKNQEIEVRKTYWSLIANVESQKITKRLMKTAQEQLKVAESKMRHSVSDAGDVARSKAQLSTREGTLLLLNYQKSLYIKALKHQLPELQTSEFNLMPVDIDKTVKKVLQCANLIKGYGQTPWENTSIDDLLKLIESNHQATTKVINTHSDVDVKLSTEVHMTGVDNGYSEAYDNLSDNGRYGYSVGLSLSVPLGGGKRHTESLKRKLEQKRFDAEKLAYLQRANTEHEQIIPLIVLLEAAARTQKANSHNLQVSLNNMNKKYRQARIDVTRLINDQDALMQSLLTEINTQLSIIHNLLDYFKTFSETPCALNNLG